MELSKEERQEVERMKELIQSQMMKHLTKEELKKKHDQERILKRRENQKRWEMFKKDKRKEPRECSKPGTYLKPEHMMERFKRIQREET